jgi:single-strand DNA-binding protein
MAGSINKVILVGNLGRDPEVRTFQNGGKVCNLSIATSENWKDKQTGERKERTEWHRVVVLNENIVKVAENYLKKGAKLYIEGQLETRKFTDKDGAEKYTTEVVLRPYTGQLTMLDSAGDRGAGGMGAALPPHDYEQGGMSGGSAGGMNTGAARSGAMPELDDDVPF